MDAPKAALAWINGTICPSSEAMVRADDRGFHFGDGVYEVLRVYSGCVFALEEHFDRLLLSATGIGIDLSPHIGKLMLAGAELLSRLPAGDALIYVQVTRGAATRNHLCPPNLEPTLLVSIKPLAPMPVPGTTAGLKLLTVPDDRWKKCWIKSIALLPNVLARHAAHQAGCDEAVFDDDGLLREGSTSNIAIIQKGTLITPHLHDKILAGVTRLAMLRVAKQIRLPIQERDIRRDEIAACDEAMITSTTREIAWVSHWDGRPISPECGPLTLKLARALADHIRQSVQPVPPPAVPVLH